MWQKFTNLRRDRLVWFVALGFALFAIEHVAQQRASQRILIDLPLVQKLVAQWEGQTKRRPNAQELDALIEGYIREEILVREAHRLGLDDDDVIIRRRLAQKVEFFLAENDPPELPDEAGLRQWFEANRSAYDAPPKLGWRHIYASNRGEAQALLRAVKVSAANWREMGQPFMLNRTYARQDQSDLAQLMGADFARALFDAPQTGWFGPVQSAYGWHVVIIDARHAARLAQFDVIAEKVARDWQNQKARESAQLAWRELRSSYDIELVAVEDQ